MIEGLNRPLKLPRTSYRSLSIPPIELSEDLYPARFRGSDLQTMIPESSPLSWKALLYLVGSDSSSRGDTDIENLPYNVKRGGDRVYQSFQDGRGHVHRDLVFIDRRMKRIKGTSRPDNYIGAVYFKEIDCIKFRPDRPNTIQSSEVTVQENVWIPPNGYIVPTRDGLYDKFGLPFETVTDKRKALARLKDAGLPESTLSTFKRGGDGIYTVISWSDYNEGIFAIDLSLMPSQRKVKFCENGLAGIYPLPAARDLEMDEAPRNDEFRVISRKEYQDLAKSRELLRKLSRGKRGYELSFVRSKKPEKPLESSLGDI